MIEPRQATVKVPFEEVVQPTFLFFFFQAEDGIRDKLVTGVQTCALPIWSGTAPFNARLRDGSHRASRRRTAPSPSPDPAGLSVGGHRAPRRRAARRGRSTRPRTPRSEERRVGKEGRSRARTEQQERRNGG